MTSRTPRQAATLALLALACVASPPPARAAEVASRPVRLVSVTADALGRDWVRAHFPGANFSVDNGYWAGVDKARGDELRVVVVSGVSTCSGDPTDQRCPMVVYRPAVAGRPEAVAFSGMVCADPDEVAVSEDHRSLRTCATAHDLR